MFVVIADGNVVFSSDIDDVAWQDCEDRKPDYKKIYVEAVYYESFDSQGKYKTIEGDLITIEDIVNAEQYYRDDGQRPKTTNKSAKKGKQKIKKKDRSYISEKVDSLYVSGAKRLLSLLGIPFDENADEIALKELLLARIKKIKKQDDDYTEAVFRKLNDYSELSMAIPQLIRLESEEEAKRILFEMLHKLSAIVNEGMNEYLMEELLFDNLITKAEIQD